MLKEKQKYLSKLKKAYFLYLDRKARNIGYNLADEKKVTPLFIQNVIDLYQAAQTERDFKATDFYSAYHASISSDFEFLIARSLLHYSRRKSLGWNVYLRKQEQKTAPDIRIENGGKTVAVIEVKAKAGWIQPLFLKGGHDPSHVKKNIKKQLDKYSSAYKVSPEKVFLLLPTLHSVHRKKLVNRKLEYYQDNFVKNSGLLKENFIIFSKNLDLDMASEIPPSHKHFEPTDIFEKFVRKIS